MALPGGWLQLGALWGEVCGAGPLLWGTGDGADAGKAAKATAEWEEVGAGGRWGGLVVPQLWETPADSDLVVGTVNICNAAHYQQPIRFKASDCPHPLNVPNVKEGGLQGAGRLFPPSPAGVW